MADRIQLRRSKGWRKPPGTVVVARPSRWGNPHRVGQPDPATSAPLDAADAVARYRADLLAGRLAVSVEDARRDLAGHDLACWCPLDRPCHADVLLDVANDPGRASTGRWVLGALDHPD